VIFSDRDYARLHDLVFSPDWPGYRPEVKELPNGDGRVDEDKRYAHVAAKYLAQAKRAGVFSERALSVLEMYLLAAHKQALAVAHLLDCPSAFLPRFEYGALRVLQYPPGAGGHSHKDFDLFTLMLYRDAPERFQRLGNVRERGLLADPHLHIGEIGEMVGLGEANEHCVLASPAAQHSIVYFAIPDHAAVFNDGNTVGLWLEERMARSRRY
jgi:hypothetical protein